MSVKLRLKRLGKRSQALYRIVAIDESAKRQGREIEVIGTHNPHDSTKTATILNKEKLSYWLSRGAVPSKTVRHLITKTK